MAIDKTTGEIKDERQVAAAFNGSDETPAQYKTAEKEIKAAQGEPASDKQPAAKAQPTQTEKAVKTPDNTTALVKPETTGKVSVSAYIRNDIVKKRIDEMLGKRSNQFITALIAATNNVAHLNECTAPSVVNAALTVAALDLPINNNLGFAYIIPYLNSKKVGNSWVKEYEAQFQMGWKGFIQLAQRSGQYKTIAATAVYEGQLKATDPLLGDTFDWSAKTGDKILGYVAQFQLMNGFSKDLYMTMDEIKEHANRFSQAYRSDQQYDKKSSTWSNDFDAMAQKTVIKMLISKFGPMSIDPQMQMAVERDQAVIEEGGEAYPDNTEAINDRIRAAESREELSEIMESLTIDERKKVTGAMQERIKELTVTPTVPFE
jgi:recombination protein RecT